MFRPFHRRGPTVIELMQQALSSTTGGYDLLAPKFDYTPFRTPSAALRQVAKAIGPPGSQEQALDLCCGTGAGLAMLRPLCRRRVVGVDLSEGMLAEAERRLAEAPGEAQLELVCADVLQESFEPTYDVVTCFGAFGHILDQDQPRLARQVASALAPGGRFVFLSADPPGWFSPALWLGRGFNAAMHVRNALFSPPFHMYYLNFLIPRAREVLGEAGLQVEVQAAPIDVPLGSLKVVVAHKAR